VEAFRTQKETIKATYTAAEAQTRIGEAVSGISEEMGDVGMAVQRAQDKTAQMQARAGAIDELMASGALDDVTAQPNDDIQRELDQMGAGHDVDRELEQMKVEIGGEAPREIEGSAPGAAGNTSTSNGQASQAADQPQSGDGA
jgi:phage shock protein A